MDNTIASGRQKRQKLDKHGKFAALQRLKELKGAKHKYELSDNVDYVYEEVDEREYNNKVTERQDDWIVDDDGSGYVEDGRDIFDDDLDDESISKNASKMEKSKKRPRGIGRLMDSSDGTGGSHIRSMLMKMPTKKKVETNVKLETDDILGDIMSELDNRQNESLGILKTPTSNDSEKDYLRSLKLLDHKGIVQSSTPRINKITQEKKLPVNTTEKETISMEVVIKQEPQSPVKESIPESQLIEEFEPEIKQERRDSAEIEVYTEDVVTDNDVLSGMEELDWDKEAFDADAVNPEAKPSAPAVETEPTVAPVDVKTENDLTDEQLNVVWELMAGSGVKQCIPPHVEMDSSELPMLVNEEGKKVLRMFWLDAFEDMYAQPGVIFLFGKVWMEEAKVHVNCCVTIRNIDRRLYLLPREKVVDMKTDNPTETAVSMMDVYNEFNTVVAPKYKIQQFKCKEIEKHYCFDLPNIPATSEYLEVRYSASYPSLPRELKGATFCHVFGTTTNSLELFLVEKRIKGPCWLDIEMAQPTNNRVSWCKLEANVDKPAFVAVYKGKNIPPPPLVVAALSMRTVVNPKTHLSEIVMLGCLIHHNFHIDKPAPNPPFQQHFCSITKPTTGTWPFDFQEAHKQYKGTHVEKCGSERSLLAYFLAKLFKLDPDIVVGHDIVNFDLKVLLNRIQVLKVPLWSRLGRLKRSNIAKAERNVMCGRLVCDVKISGKELIRCRSYDLGAMCETVLRINADDWMEVTPDDVQKAFSSSQDVLRVLSRTMQDGAYILRLMSELNVIPLALQITNIAGNLMARTLMGGRSERNEFLLLHAFTEKGYIVPDKMYKKAKGGPRADLEELEEMVNDAGQRKGKNKAAYAGGLVLDPKKGFYDKFILLMDFNSLYPSIIQEYNICFTTVNYVKTEGETEAVIPVSETGPGILPIEIRKLVESRKQVKNLMKSPDLSADLKLQYNIRQMALKLTANSMYGCLGFSFSRFYAKPLAALVTAKGREILTNTKDLVQKLNYDVIYGDTDSLMINTNSLDYGEVFKIGHKIKAEVNKLYRLVELDVDGVFKYMLLLKKKKYAAVSITQLPNGELVTSQELKGLDIVRRDWSRLSAETGKYVLSKILSDLPPDERIDAVHCYLEKIGVDLKEGRVPLSLLAITKQLTKNPDEYADHKSQPHVQVAIRLNSRGGKPLRAGDTVAYVICEDGTNLGAMQRAYHPDELKTNDHLKIDVNYYLSQQIHPVVSRLCEPIEGTDAGRIAECLGLDPSSYHRLTQRFEERTEIGAGERPVLDNEERFRSCDKLKFICKNEKCNSENCVSAPFRKTDSGVYQWVLESCSNPDCKTQPLQYFPSILNAVTLAMRSFIQRYYQEWLICEDPACPQRTRRVPLRYQGTLPVCTLCEKAVMFREYTDNQLYTQLEYFQFMFDLSKVSPSDKKLLPPSSTVVAATLDKPGERVTRSKEVSLESLYAKAKEHVERMLLHSAYSMIDLGQLFSDCSFFFKPRVKVEVKEEPRDTSHQF